MPKNSQLNKAALDCDVFPEPDKRATFLPIMVETNENRSFYLEDTLLATAHAVISLLTSKVLTPEEIELVNKWLNGEIVEKVVFVRTDKWSCIHRQKSGSGFYGSSSTKILLPQDAASLPGPIKRMRKNRYHVSHRPYNENSEFGYASYNKEQYGIKLSLNSFTYTSIEQQIRAVARTTAKLIIEAEPEIWDNWNKYSIPVRLVKWDKTYLWNGSDQDLKIKNKMGMLSDDTCIE
jgi:hypothetical protein